MTNTAETTISAVFPGCGAGVPVAQALAGRHSVVGVDLSAAMIELEDGCQQLGNLQQDPRRDDVGRGNPQDLAAA